MNQPLLVAVGSLNPVKVNAVKLVLEKAQIAADVRGIAAPSGVREQPIGVEEIKRGAYQRAINACGALQADWGIGLEGGVEFDPDDKAWLFSTIAIVTVDGRQSTSRGAELLLPPGIAARLRAGEELGPVMDELLGTVNIKHGPGAVGFLTNGLITREEAYRDSLSRALAPLLHPDLYR
jgi:inosine/xanthosine triphosphatase